MRMHRGVAGCGRLGFIRLLWGLYYGCLPIVQRSGPVNTALCFLLTHDAVLHVVVMQTGKDPVFLVLSWGFVKQFRVSAPRCQHWTGPDQTRHIDRT